VFAGVVNETPFTVIGHPLGEVTACQVALPIAIAEGRLDIRLLDVVQSLSTLFHTARRPKIDGLPFVGSGFGVVARGTNNPVFRSPVREDAEIVAQYLADPDRYEVTAVPALPTSWIVAGPRLGSTMSRLEVVPTKDAADQLAAAWRQEHDHAIDVFEGQLPT
jgi:hypothetical protein